MTRLYGRAPQGKRLVDKVPHGHWKTTTFICGLRHDGVTAPFVLDGPMDGPHFLAYVEQILAPTLKKGQIVFLDNVSTHKVDRVEEAIEARGARAVFLPAYSPDLNPIEQLFARLKSFLRKMKARTLEQSPLLSKEFPKENAKPISQTRDTPNLIEKCSSDAHLCWRRVRKYRPRNSQSTGLLPCKRWIDGVFGKSCLPSPRDGGLRWQNLEGSQTGW
jgi:transposase